MNADGSVQFRSNDHYFHDRPGQDTPRLELESAPVQFRLGLNASPTFRTLQEECLPVCITTWDMDGVKVQETAVVTELSGTPAISSLPPADAFAVFMARLEFTNPKGSEATAMLPLSVRSGNQPLALRVDEDGILWSSSGVRGQVVTDQPLATGSEGLRWSASLAPGQSRTLILKIPYVVLTGNDERAALMHLDFDRERTAVAGYWRRRLDRSAHLITPEPMLNEFYRADAMHLLDQLRA